MLRTFTFRNNLRPIFARMKCSKSDQAWLPSIFGAQKNISTSPCSLDSRISSQSRSSSATSTTSTINSEELLKFSTKSSEWWSPHGEFAMLQKMNPIRVRYLRQMILNPYDVSSPYPFANFRILDIGCGGGLLSESLVRLGATVVGADASHENIQMARVHARKDPALWVGPGRLEYRNLTAEALLAQGERFDIVCAMEVIEHVANPAHFLTLCAELVNSGGYFVISTISRTPLAYFLTVFLAESVLGMVHQGTHDWNKYIKSDELVEGVNELKGWEVKDVRGISWNPLIKRWVLSERGTGIPGFSATEVNYFLAARKSNDRDNIQV